MDQKREKTFYVQCVALMAAITKLVYFPFDCSPTICKYSLTVQPVSSHLFVCFSYLFQAEAHHGSLPVLGNGC